MPYTADHKLKTRKRILSCARQMFIQKGYSEVSIDEIMAEAGLTRGGFYNHFKNKEQLFAEAIESFLECQMTAERPTDAVSRPLTPREMAHGFVDAYLSERHMLENEMVCPLIALPSDVARAGPDVKAGYQKLFKAMVGVFEQNLAPDSSMNAHQSALALAATCIGGMVLARAVGDPVLSNNIRTAAQTVARNSLEPVVEDKLPEQAHTVVA